MHSARFTNSARHIWVFSPLTRTLGAGLVFAQETNENPQNFTAVYPA